MGIITRAGDLVYTFRFLNMLTTPFEKTKAFELGIIDGDGKRVKSVKLDTDEKKSAYTPFNRLVYNIKRLIPAGNIGSYASALYLLKDHYIQNPYEIEKLIHKAGFDQLDFMAETTQWYVVDDKMLSPGLYKVKEDKLLIDTLDDIVYERDKVRVKEDCYPVGDIMGLDIYRVQHVKTGKDIYITLGELIK